MLLCLVYIMTGCKAAKTINKVIAPKDTTTLVTIPVSVDDSIKFVDESRALMQKNEIAFKTFSAKIKLDIEDSRGKQPDIVATLRMIKDSAIWLSLNATFLNIEVYRALITRDSVILMNKQDKEVQYRTLDYLQEVTQIPFDFKTMQNMLIGNPVFFDSAIASFKTDDKSFMATSVGASFKTLVTLALSSGLMQYIKLDDVDISRNRTASMSYDDYVANADRMFSTRRQITISEKNKLEIKMNFKQFEFNKELSVNFSVPKNYKKK